MVGGLSGWVSEINGHQLWLRRTHWGAKLGKNPDTVGTITMCVNTHAYVHR